MTVKVQINENFTSAGEAKTYLKKYSNGLKNGHTVRPQSARITRTIHRQLVEWRNKKGKLLQKIIRGSNKDPVQLAIQSGQLALLNTLLNNYSNERARNFVRRYNNFPNKVKRLLSQLGTNNRPMTGVQNLSQPEINSMMKLFHMGLTQPRSSAYNGRGSP